MVLPTWLGVAVEPAADRADLRAVANGFMVVGARVASTMEPGPESRRFDFRSEADGALVNRMRAQLSGAANAAPRARTRERMAAAQTMIALGLGVEAQALGQVIASDDPQAAADAELVAVLGIAAVLAGRPGEAAELDDPRLDGNDEIALWRGLRDKLAGQDTAAARGLGRFSRLVASYPAALRKAAGTAVAEAAVETRSEPSNQALPSFAAAMAMQRDGKLDEALAAFDVIGNGSDRLDQVRATVRAAEIRLAAGRITPLQAAAIVERQSFAWRGDFREVALRLRSAELRAAAGEWRVAFDALKGLETAMPDQREVIRSRKALVMQMMLNAEGGSLSALDLVLLAKECADCVPDGPAGMALARLLADKLLALDLPARAIPVLQGLVQAAPPGQARAEFGTRLAQLLLEGGDAAGALAALDASGASGLPAPALEARGLLRARILAAAGETGDAVRDLARLGTEAADDLRATLLAEAGDWRGAQSALEALASRRVSPNGPLDAAAQDVLLRQVVAAAQLSDGPKLTALASFAARVTGPRGELFRVLTSPALEAAVDLPRARRELASARGLPQQLQSLSVR